MTGHITLDLLIMVVVLALGGYLWFDFEGKRLDRKYPRPESREYRD